jgi:hypothetical protein
MKVSKGTALTLGFLLFIGGLSFTLISTGNKYECNICIRYKGTDSCQTMVGAEKHEIISQGISTACGGAARGMTESIECQATQPTKVECKEI